MQARFPACYFLVLNMAMLAPDQYLTHISQKEVPYSDFILRTTIVSFP